MTTPVLSVREVSMRFGGIVALSAITFDMAQGAILGLIGPNGAGKTTLFNCLSRLYRPTSGDIQFQGKSILNTQAHAIAKLGIGRTFQTLALFRGMSVLDNVLVGAHSRLRANSLDDAFRTLRASGSEREAMRIALEALDHLSLREYSDNLVGELPFGTQKRVELARALATDPVLLLLDEPACGLNHEEVHALSGLIRSIRDEKGLSILIVEHNMDLVMSVSDMIVALNFGRKIGEGTPEMIKADPVVIAAYLGGG
jgi:branched-chain amino acid transport system ATP-binding protein